jgi:hypothetical protein
MVRQVSSIDWIEVWRRKKSLALAARMAVIGPSDWSRANVSSWLGSRLARAASLVGVVESPARRRRG